MVRLDDSVGDYLELATGIPLAAEIRSHLSVNAPDLGTAIEVPPGTTDVLIQQTFALSQTAPLADFQGRKFKKAIQLRLASTPGG